MARPLPTPVRHVPDAERRARLGVRHLLAPGTGAASAPEAAEAIGALHATELASVFLSAWARTPGVTVEAIDRALWVEQSLVPQLSLRQTLFAWPRDLLPAVLGTSGRRGADTLGRTLARLVEKEGIADDGAAWVGRACAAVFATLAADGPLSTRQVREATPAASASFAQGEGTRWAGTIQLTPRILWLLHLQGRVHRAGNEGDWRNSRPVWDTTERVLGDVEVLDVEAGWAALVRRYLASHGPATVDNVAWWLGAPKGVVTVALASLDAVPVSLDGVAAPGWLLPDDLAVVEDPDGWVALLPLLDPAIMGWKDRSFVLGPHGDAMFDSVGNAGTSVWVDGRVVGAWVQDDEQRVRLNLLEPVPDARRVALAETAERLTDWLDGQRVFSVYPSAAMRA